MALCWPPCLLWCIVAPACSMDAWCRLQPHRCGCAGTLMPQKQLLLACEMLCSCCGHRANTAPALPVGSLLEHKHWSCCQARTGPASSAPPMTCMQAGRRVLLTLLGMCRRCRQRSSGSPGSWPTVACRPGALVLYSCTQGLPQPVFLLRPATGCQGSAPRICPSQLLCWE